MIKKAGTNVCYKNASSGYVFEIGQYAEFWVYIRKQPPSKRTFQKLLEPIVVTNRLLKRTKKLKQKKMDAWIELNKNRDRDEREKRSSLFDSTG